MPKPATLRDLVKIIHGSRLIDEAQLVGFLRTLRDAKVGRVTQDDLLVRLVTAGHLTPFQAGQLAVGKWRGFVIGSYRLQTKIGCGGMGQVYLAHHMTTGRPVAIKMLNAQLIHDPAARVRFTREAQAAAAMTHPNIVRVIDVDADATPPFLVMEYIDGLSLQAAVATHGTLSVGWTAHCGHQIAQGLQVAHQFHLVHRDIKPANVLMDQSGQVKILDLGIALIGNEEVPTTTASKRLILGTADYLAPEQARDSEAVDTRADLYALGGTLYFLLTGQPPFPDGNAQMKLARKQAADPIAIERLRPDVPHDFAVVVHKLLARNLTERYQTPTEAVEALAPFVAAETTWLAKLFSSTRCTVSDQAHSPTSVNLPQVIVFNADSHPAHRDPGHHPAASDPTQGQLDSSQLHAAFLGTARRSTPLPQSLAAMSYNHVVLDEDQATVEISVPESVDDMPVTMRLQDAPSRAVPWPRDRVIGLTIIAIFAGIVFVALVSAIF